MANGGHNNVIYEEGTVNNRISQKWFMKFHAGDFSLNESLGLGLIAGRLNHYLRIIRANIQIKY